MMKKTLLIAGFSLLAGICTSFAQDAAEKPAYPLKTEAPKDAKCYIISPKNGKTVKAKDGKVKIVFGLSGIGVAPAGVHLEDKPTGHHHLLIDMDSSELPSLEIPIPMIEGKCLHFGGGQTEAMVPMAPGKHTLQLVLGNWSHVPHVPPVISEKIEITVE